MFLIKFKTFQDMMNLQELMIGDSFYWLCAFIGSGMFFIQLCLNLIGLDEPEGLDHESLADVGKFKWLSRQALTGFLMMFGWSALTCQKQFHLESALTLFIAFLCGVIAVLVTGCIFKIAKKLHNSGTIFKIEDTIGQEAVVYQRIPPNGVGKVCVCIEGFTREVDARSIHYQEVPSFARVKIMNKMDDQTVVVEII